MRRAARGLARAAARLSLLALVAVSAAACGSAPPAMRHYALVVPSERRSPPAQGATLAVIPLVADAAYDTDRIVYRLSPYRLDYYEYHRWAASPGLLLADYLREAYARAGLFRVVVAERESETHAVLAGRIAALEEVDESPERWHAHVTLELTLRDAQSGAHLWSATYERRDPMPERSPEGLARALSGAIARIVAESAPALAEHGARAGTGNEPR